MEDCADLSEADLDEIQARHHTCLSLGGTLASARAATPLILAWAVQQSSLIMSFVCTPAAASACPQCPRRWPALPMSASPSLSLRLSLCRARALSPHLSLSPSLALVVAAPLVPFCFSCYNTQPTYLSDPHTLPLRINADHRCSTKEADPCERPGRVQKCCGVWSAGWRPPVKGTPASRSAKTACEQHQHQ